MQLRTTPHYTAPYNTTRRHTAPNFTPLHHASLLYT
uniref:Uncharacterized protein n=1 Tax=Mesocestoides corti TaxID=53468 RepID=A0A5K3G1Z8_MESCO